MVSQKIEDIVGKQAYDQLEKLVDMLKASEQSLEAAAKAGLKFKSSFEGKGADAYNKNLKESKKLNEDLAKELINREKIEQQIQKTAQAAIQTKITENKLLAQNKKAVEEQTSAYAKLSKELNEARKKAKDLAAQYGENDKRAQSAARSANELDRRVKSIDASVGQHQRNVGNYGSALSGVGRAFVGMLGPLIGANVALQAFQKIMQVNDSLLDAFNEKMASLKAVINVLASSIGRMDFKNLGENMREAAAAAREYTAAMDKMDDQKRGFAVTEAKLNEEMKKQELIFRDRSKSAKERAAAEKEMLNIQRDLITEQSRFAGGAYANELNRIAAEARNTGLTMQDLVNFTENYAEMEAKAAKEGGDAVLKLRAFNNISEENRDTLSKASIEVHKYNAAMTEFQIGLLRAHNQISKQGDKEDELSKGRRVATGETIALASALKIEGEALEPIIDLLIKMGVASEDVIKFQKRMTEETQKAVKGQFDLRKGGAEKLAALNEDFNNKELDKERELWDAKKQIAQEGFQVLASFENSYFERKRMALDDEYAALEKQKDQKLITDEQYIKGKEAIDKKSRKLARDKAISDRILASAQVVYQFMQAQAEAAALSPLTLGLPWSAILQGMQALSLAAIWAAPLPKLAKGIKDSPAMFAEVGEAGPELIESNGKSQWVTQSTKMFLPKGTNVIPLKDLAERSGAFAFAPSMKDGKAGYDLTKLIEAQKQGDEAIIRAIKSKETVTEVKMRGMFDSMRWNSYVDQNFRR